jgi:polyisoprenoid-binding protein YceI
MKARSRFALITTTFAALSLSAIASADMKYIGGGGLEFKLPGGTAGLSIDGTSDNVTAQESGAKIVVTVKLDCAGKSCLKTGIDTRDEHLYDHIEAGKFPTATLSVDKSKLSLPADNATSEGEATGDLTFHGVTRPVKFKYGAKRTGSDYHVHGSTSINLGDFKLERPEHFHIHTGMTAEIKIKFKLRDS